MKTFTPLMMSAILLLLCVSPAAAQWIPSGVPVCTEPDRQIGPSIVSDESGGAIIKWDDDRDRTRPKTFMQRIDANGVPLWTYNGIPAGDTTRSYGSYGMISDGAGGAIILWTYTASFKEEDIYAQRISANGAPLWTNDGMPVCTATGSQPVVRMISDGAQGAFFAWEDGRISGQITYAQRISGSGTPLWAANGLRMCTAAGNERRQTITPDDAGGAIMAWQDSRSGVWDIYAQRVTSSGALLWTESGAAVCTAENMQVEPLMVPDGANGAIVVFRTFNNTDYDLLAQRIDANGTILWAAEGVPVSTAADDQMYYKVLRDGSGGVIILWEDYRSGSIELYGQRLDGNGQPLWQTDGQALGIGDYLNYSWAVTSDEAGGFIIAWTDTRLTGYGGNTTFAQRFDGDCLPLWTPGGIPVCLESQNQKAPTLTSDLTNGAIVAWQDCRLASCYDYYYDIYAQHLNPDYGIIATLLQSYSASCTETGIAVEWTLSEIGSDARFSVLRARAPDFDFAELGGATIERTGMTFSIIDRSAQPGVTYKYRIAVSDMGDRKILFETDAIEVPGRPLTLFQNYPNPFNPSTMVSYYLPERCNVRLCIYAASGTLVRVLDAGIRERGRHAIPWDGRTSDGRIVSSGIYFSRLKAGPVSLSRKMAVLK